MRNGGAFFCGASFLVVGATSALLLAGPARGDVVAGVYVGSSKTNVKYLDPATLQVMSTASYPRKVRLSIAAPLRNGVMTETNPFSLTLVPLSRNNGLKPGQVFAGSARVFTVNGGSVLLQYWDLTNTIDGFVGSLINNHLADGAAKERVIALAGGPGGTPKKFLMHDASIGTALQCQMTATTSDRQLTLKLTGYAFVPGEAIIRFTTKIDAQRP